MLSYEQPHILRDIKQGHIGGDLHDSLHYSCTGICPRRSPPHSYFLDPSIVSGVCIPCIPWIGFWGSDDSLDGSDLADSPTTALAEDDKEDFDFHV